jgi:hypothetical protein
MRRTSTEVGNLPPESLSDETRDRLLDTFRHSLGSSDPGSSDRGVGVTPLGRAEPKQ